MERSEESKISEFHSRMAAIRAEFDSLKKVVLSKEEEQEESKMLSDFDSAVQTQVFGTLEHLMAYQINGWRELADGGDNGEDGTDPVPS